MRCIGMIVNDRNRGFHLFDTDTLEHTPVNNPYQLFHNLYYEDTPHQMLDITKYDQKILKVMFVRSQIQNNLKSTLINFTHQI